MRQLQAVMRRRRKYTRRYPQLPRDGIDQPVPLVFDISGLGVHVTGEPACAQLPLERRNPRRTLLGVLRPAVIRKSETAPLAHDKWHMPAHEERIAHDEWL